MSTQLDEMLAEGKHPAGSFENTEIAAVRNRCRIGQVSLYGGALAEFGVSWDKRGACKTSIAMAPSPYLPPGASAQVGIAFFGFAYSGRNKRKK